MSDAPELPKVELHAAWSWTCDKCGRDNFCHSVTAEITPEDAAEHFPFEDYADIQGAYYTMPADVECQFCGTEYETEDPRETDD